MTNASIIDKHFEAILQSLAVRCESGRTHDLRYLPLDRRYVRLPTLHNSYWIIESHTAQKSHQRLVFMNNCTDNSLEWKHKKDGPFLAILVRSEAIEPFAYHWYPSPSIGSVADWVRDQTLVNTWFSRIDMLDRSSSLHWNKHKTSVPVITDH